MYYFTLQVFQKTLLYISKKLETPPVEGSISFPSPLFLIHFSFKGPNSARDLKHLNTHVSTLVKVCLGELNQTLYFRTAWQMVPMLLFCKNLAPRLSIFSALFTYFFASVFSTSDFSPLREFYLLEMENQNGG